MVLFLLGKQEVSAVEPSAYKLPFCILLYQIIAARFCPMKVFGESVHTQIHVHVLVSHVLHVQITMLGLFMLLFIACCSGTCPNKNFVLILR